jgi:hypothetical protein
MTVRVSSKLTATLLFIFSRKEARGMVKSSRFKEKGERRKEAVLKRRLFHL